MSVEKCPDLTKWGLVKPGICSSSSAMQKIVEAGDLENLMVAKKRETAYSLHNVADALGMPNAFVIGASAIPLKGKEEGGELIVNEDLDTNTGIVIK